MEKPLIPTYLFGHPRQGIRQIRIPILDWSLIDTLATYWAAAYLARRHYISSSTLSNFIILLVLGHFLHRLAGIKDPTLL